MKFDMYQYFIIISAVSIAYGKICRQKDFDEFISCTGQSLFQENYSKCFTDNNCPAPIFNKAGHSTNDSGTTSSNSCVEKVEQDVRAAVQQCVQERLNETLDLSKFENHMRGNLPHVIFTQSHEPMPKDDDPLPTLPVAVHNTTETGINASLCPAFENVMKCIHGLKPQRCETERRCLKLQK